MTRDEGGGDSGADLGALMSYTWRHWTAICGRLELP